MKRGMFVMVSILLLMTESDNSCELDTNDSKIAAIAEGLNDDWAKWEEAKCQAMMHVKGNNLEKNNNNLDVNFVVQSHKLASDNHSEVIVKYSRNSPRVVRESNLYWFLSQNTSKGFYYNLVILQMFKDTFKTILNGQARDF